MIKVANAPCSWGVLEFNLEGQAAGYAQVLREMQETGYAGTELGDWGFMPTDPVRLKVELDAHGLTMLAAFIPVMLKDRAAHAPGAETAVRTARLLAGVNGKVPYIVLADDNGKDPVRTRNAGRVTPEMGLSDAEWQIAAEGVQKVAESVYKETGLRTVFHHHCAGYIETPAEVEKLLSLTGPKLVGLVLDTGHYRFGGGDPLTGLRKHASRIWHVHFKDCHPGIAAQSRKEGWDYFESVRHGIFCELGKGEVDFPAIKAELDKMGYQGWIVVEQDVLPGMGTPKASAQRNRDYLKSIGL
ncbi:MAG TPA: TIM barrel protein [Aggregatilineales bacterium]|nr:TIM barrel protein [Aggregatilineales bacterium]